MVRDDDDLARVLAKADPTRTPPNARPDAAALAARDRIIATEPAVTAPRRRALPRVVLTAAAAMVVVAVAAVTFIFPRTPAAAITPAPIVFAGGGTVAEMARHATETLARSSGPAAPARGAHTVMWGLAVEPEAQRAEIVPQVAKLHWNKDLSGSFTVVAGEPYWPDGAATGGVATATVEPGEVLSEMRFAPGEYGTPVVELPGSSREDVLALLTAFGLPASPTASDVVQAMTSVFDHWTLTNEQHAQLISILVDTRGLTVLGTGEDRAGRRVVGVEMTSFFPGIVDLVLISAETGRIVGVESKRVTPDGNVPAGAVISYRLWDTA